MNHFKGFVHHCAIIFSFHTRAKLRCNCEAVFPIYVLCVFLLHLFLLILYSRMDNEDNDNKDEDKDGARGSNL